MVAKCDGINYSHHEYGGKVHDKVADECFIYSTVITK